MALKDKFPFVHDLLKFGWNTAADKAVMQEMTEGGAAHVNTRQGTGKVARNRYVELDNAGTEANVIWPAGANIAELILFSQFHIGETATLGAKVVVCIDPANDALGDSFLTIINSPDNDVQWYPVKTTAEGWETRFPLEHALTQGLYNGGVLRMKTVGGKAIDVWVGAN